MAYAQEVAFTQRVPTYDELNWPALIALRNLGGSASIAEYLTQVISDQGVPEKVSSMPHGKTGRSELEYRLAWARTASRRCGYLENSSRGVWSLTEAGEHATQDQLKQKIVELSAIDRKKFVSISKDQAGPIGEDELEDWRDTLLEVLKSIAPDAFERLCKRLLRKSGFIQV